MERLSRAQERVYTQLAALTEDGWPASVRDVGKAAGLASPSSTHRHLVELERLGYAATHPRSPRGGWKALTPA